MFITRRCGGAWSGEKIFLASAFFLLVGIPAMADDVPNPAAQVLTVSPYQAPGALPEGVGILGRARPEYDAQGASIGGFYLYPTIAASLSSDDNVFRRSSAQVSDLFWTFSPRVALRSQWSEDSLRLYAQLDDYQYDRQDSESRTNWIVGGTGNLAVASGATLSADTYYFNTHESRTSPDLSSQALSPTAYTQFHADASILNQPGPVGLSAGVNYDRYVYDPTALVGGGLLDNADRNSDVVEAFAKALYEFQPEESVYARVSYNVREFDLHFDRNGFDHSSDGYRIDTGLQMLFTPLIKGTMFLGYLQQDFKEPFHSVSGINFGSQIDWFATELVTVHFTTNRLLTDTIIAGASSEDQRSIRASFDYELLRNVILQGNIGYENDIFDGISRNDRITTAGFGAKYLLNRNMSLYADYIRGERSSNAMGENFTDNLVTAGIRFQY
jgi:hypothetical protein